MTSGTTQTHDPKNLVLADGDKKIFENVAEGSLLQVVPGVGATVSVQYLLTPDGAPYDWPAGNVTAAAHDTVPGPLAQIIITSTGGTAKAELAQFH